MNTDKLLKTLPVLQAQLDGLLEFDCQANDLTNGKNNLQLFLKLCPIMLIIWKCFSISLFPSV